MLDSVQVLLQVTVPATITAGALIWQNRENSKREDRRREEDRAERQKDREHQTSESTAQREAQRALSDASQRAAVEERWRDQRLAAHTHLLDLIGKRIEQCQPNVIKLRVRDAVFDNYQDDELMDQINAADAKVQLIASGTAANKARLAHGACQSADISLWTAVLVRDPDLGELDGQIEEETRTKAQADLRAARVALDEYRQAARVDLGTD